MSIDFGSYIPSGGLGFGYSSDREMPANFMCLRNSSFEYILQKTSTIDFGTNVTSQYVKNSLVRGLDFSLGVGIFGLDADVSYLQSLKSSEFSIIKNYLSIISYGTKSYDFTSGWGKELLNGLGQGVYSEGSKKFRDICGDQFISEEHLGIKLLASFKLDLDSSESVEKFNEHFDLNVGILSISESVQDIATFYKANGTLTFEVRQVGGEVYKTLGFFGGNKAVAVCDINNTSSCSEITKKIIDYAENDFPYQVNITSDNGWSGNLAATAYSYQEYARIGLNVSKSILDNSIIEARAKLINAYYDMSDKKNFLEHELQYDVSPSNRSETENLLNNVNYNLDLILSQNTDQGAIGCYVNTLECPEIANYIFGHFKPIVENLIEF